MKVLTPSWQLIRKLMKQAGPYLLIELLLPGGTLLAFILLIYRSGGLTALQPMSMVPQEYSERVTLLQRPADTVRHLRFDACLVP